MPVRSSICAYSPSSVSASSNKYSSNLLGPSPLSIGHYKPMNSFSSSSSSGSSVSSSYKPLNSTSSFRSSAAATSSSSLGRYSPAASSTYTGASSPYSSASSTASSGRGSSGLYNSPLAATHNSTTKLIGSSRFGTPLSSSSSPSSSRYSSGSLASNSSTASSTASSSALSSPSHYTSGHRNRYQESILSSLGGAKYEPSLTSSSYHSYSPSSATLKRRTATSSPASPPSAFSSVLFSSSSTPPTASPSDNYQPPAGVPRGLINLGNTCYMNASLQALYSIEALRALLLTRAPHDKFLTSELSDLFKSMKNSSSPISPSDFKYAFSRYQAKFAGLGQQDAQEFLRYLINGIHEELNQAAVSKGRRSTSYSPAARQPPKTADEAWSQYREIVDDSPLVNLVVGQLCSTIVCGQCQSKSHCWDPFWDLSLPLVRTTCGGSGSSRYSSSSLRLSQVVEDFLAKETLDADERPICSQCKKATRSTKQISLSRLPQVLILHLKKFTNDGYKLSSPQIEIEKSLTFNQTTYSLKACISHHGHSSSSGHYTSHCEYANRWFHFNDDRVRDVTSSFNCSKLDDAYVLFYTQSRGSCTVLPSQQSKL